MEGSRTASVVVALLATACCCRRDPCPCGPVAVVAAPAPASPAPIAATVPAAAPAKAPPAPAAPVPVGDAKAAPSGEEAIHAILKGKKVRDLEFHDNSLDQVAQYIHTVTGVPVHISPKAREANAGDIKISIPRQPEICCAEVLDIVTAPWELAWEVRDGIIHIETKDEAAAASR